MKFEGLYKIGRSIDPNRRRGQLNSTYRGIELLGFTFKYDELELHKKYANYNYTGEWFYFPGFIINELLKDFTLDKEIAKKQLQCIIDLIQKLENK